jgi:hypothetical protein
VAIVAQARVTGQRGYRRSALVSGADRATLVPRDARRLTNDWEDDMTLEITYCGQ